MKYYNEEARMSQSRWVSVLERKEAASAGSRLTITRPVTKIPFKEKLNKKCESQHAFVLVNLHFEPAHTQTRRDR